MNRDQLAVLIEEYDQAGPPLHELLRVDRSELKRWLDGAPIPAARVHELDWWASALRARRAIEASGLPECAEMNALDRSAQAAILRNAPKKEQSRAAQAALDHAAACDLCRQREALRQSAGPMKGEPFPGYRRAMEGTPPEEWATILWFMGVFLSFGVGVMYFTPDGAATPRLPWFIAWIGLTMPWIVRAVSPTVTQSIRWAGYLCAACGVLGLASTDFEALLAAQGWLAFVPPVGFFALGLWARLAGVGHKSRL